MTKQLLLLAALTALTAGATACKSAGMGAETRADIQATMQTAEAPIAACYEAALKQKRGTKGRFSMRLTAEGGTGQFKNIQVLRDEPRNPALARCVLAEIGKLKLSKPTSASVQIDQPLHFAPNN